MERFYYPIKLCFRLAKSWLFCRFVAKFGKIIVQKFCGELKLRPWWSDH